jgi:hypothetical protein
MAACLAAMTHPQVHAITLNMTYFNEGDPVPHDENPIWDPDGAILKSHFQAAKTIWENLLPGGGSYDLEFEWDDDIDPLGLTSPDSQNPGDFFIEMNSTKNWFADPTPGTNEEFATMPTQMLYGQLSASDQWTYFPVASPPFTLETRYNLAGTDGTFGLGGYDAQDGHDLLTVILHELGHVLAINNVLPGNWTIDPQHVGGQADVWVLGTFAIPGGSHLAGDWQVPGFLMCPASPTGQRILPSATDILVIADDQNISQVHLARVDRIGGGQWSNASSWIGGDVPDNTQDVYIRTPGDMSVTLDTDAQAKNIYAGVTASLGVQNHRLTVQGTLDYNAGTLHVAAGGVIDAHKIIADQIDANAGSLVRFNSYKRGGLSGTTVSFGGAVAIGSELGPAILDPFTPTDYTTWNIGGDLTIGDKKTAMLSLNGAIWNVGGDVLVGGEKSGTLFINSLSGTPLVHAIMHIGGNLEVHGTNNGDVSSVLVSEPLDELVVTGHIIVGQRGAVTIRNQNPPRTTYEVRGGETTVVGGPTPTPYAFQYSTSGALSFAHSTNAVFVQDSTIEVEGGRGHQAPGGIVSFRGVASIVSGTTIHTFGGRGGPKSPFLPDLDEAGNGGQVRFEDTSEAADALIINEGVSESRSGTGGLTVFANNSRAILAKIHNLGAKVKKGGGGATQFFNSASAEAAQIFNYADAVSIYPSMAAQTVFFDSSIAENATIENESGPFVYNAPGRTEFRNNSSAEYATINNRGNPNFGGGAGGLTQFYNSATAANATINLYEGFDNSGRTDFYDTSTAANATITIVNTDPPGGSANGGGGNLIFHDNSTAENAQITLKAGACCNGVLFLGHATAASANFVQESGSGRIDFADDSTAGAAVFTVGQDNELAFFNQANAGNALVSVDNRARLQFTNSASAAQSTIGISGASASSPSNPGSLVFNLTSTAGDAFIYAHGGTTAGAVGSRVSFINGAHAGNATIFAEGGTGGGGGAIVSFYSGATGNTARLVAEAGGTFDFGDQRTFNGTQVGSIEGAGTFVLNGSLLTTGNRSTNTTVSGPITNGNLGGGALTKVGTGQLTLAGANTYTGLTTVNAGTLSITGSIKNDALVASGATLNGTGTIGGTVTVSSGGVLAPGLSPGTLTLHGLTMMSNSTLNFEIGDPLRDRIMLTGNVALSGTLNVSLLGGYTPTLGQTFPVFEGNVGTITGSFDFLVAPTFNGLTFSVSQTPGSLLLQVIPAGSGSGSDLDSVPEPNGWQLIVMGGLLLIVLVRPRTNPRRSATERHVVGRASCILVSACSLSAIILLPIEIHATTVTVNGTNGTAGAAGTGGISGTAGGNGGNGADATATAAAAADTSNTATATGGIGGQGGVGGNATSGTAGDGGNGASPGNATATATTTANGSSTSANASATGGRGGNGGQGGSATFPGGLPGNGGFATAPGGSAIASASVTNGQPGGSVNVQATATGGAGGNGGAVGATPSSPLKVGQSGTNGGSASLGTVSGTANGGAVAMTATIVGGTGGNGAATIGSGGNGENASLTNAMTASTTGPITLTQNVTGGQGGLTSNGAAGLAGSATSSMTLSDLVASALTGSSVARGGLGGGGGANNGANGGDAASNISFTGKGAVTVTSTSTGGNGGAGSSSSVTQLKSGGDGGTATNTASGTSTIGGAVSVRADNFGGTGGSGAIGGSGADALLVNAVTGATTGILTLTQNATAGSGGNGSVAASGEGGDAISTLTFSQSGPSTLTINTMAAGAGSASGAIAAAGGIAFSAIDATCTGTAMNLTAQAIGNTGTTINVSGSNNNAGDGGSGIIGIVRGVALSPGSVTLDLRATSNGGAGGSVTTGAGNGGNGGAASLIDDIEASASITSNATLRPTAGGGAGGSALNGLAGRGGAAINALTRSFNVNSLTVLPSTVGGAGGAKTSGSGFAGAGGNAIANLTISNMSGSLQLSHAATGGAGGAGSSGASGGTGGNATASAVGSNAVNQNVIVGGTATGGNGGSASGAGSGGNGGSATVNSVTGISTSGSVGVTAQQFGGNGGDHTSGTSGSGGNGAPSSMTNVVSGSTSGTLTLTQSAISGAGGAGNGAAGGSSSNALSSLNIANPGGGRIFATANAQSGIGGSTFGTGTPGNSGDATATIYAFSSTNLVGATANAQAGVAGTNSSNMATGTRGIGTAFAHAATAGGFLADATAIVNGRNAVANAVADTSSGILNSMSLSATGNPTNTISGSMSVHAYGKVGNGFESFPGNTAAHAAGLPTVTDVNTNLSGDPNVTAAYNSPDGKTPLALAALSLASPGFGPATSITLSTSASFSFDVTTLQSGKLLVGLLDPVNTGPAFTSLHFSISREGAIVEDQTFATPAAATTYFNDHVLDFGALKANISETLDLRFALDMTTLDNGARYGINFLVADVGIVGTPGDYNNNGLVDAGDYVLWRKYNNTATTLPNDSTPGTDTSDYTVWRSHFGQPSGSSTNAIALEGTSVPEPTTNMIVWTLVVVPFVRRNAPIIAYSKPRRSPGNETIAGLKRCHLEWPNNG